MIKVNPPPSVKLPKKFSEDKEILSYFQQVERINYQLWLRTGAGSDYINDLRNTNYREITGDTILTSADFGSVILVDTTTGDINITLPDPTDININRPITILVVNSTNDCFVLYDNILGDTSVLMDDDYMSITFRPISLTEYGAT